MKSVQFNLRQMLTATVVCAAVSAVAAPFLRQLPERRLLWMGAALGTGAVTFVLAILWRLLQRQRLETVAGKIFVQSRQPPDVAGVSGLLLACAAAVEVLIIAMLALGGATSGVAVLAIFIAACCSPIWSKVGILYAWQMSEETVELRDRGVIVGGLSYYSWGQVKSYSWHEAGDSPMLWLTLDDQIVGASVEPRQRPEADTLLAANIGPAADADASADLETEPIH